MSACCCSSLSIIVNLPVMTSFVSMAILVISVFPSAKSYNGCSGAAVTSWYSSFHPFQGLLSTFDPHQEKFKIPADAAAFTSWASLAGPKHLIYSTVDSSKLWTSNSSVSLDPVVQGPRIQLPLQTPYSGGTDPLE